MVDGWTVTAPEAPNDDPVSAPTQGVIGTHQRAGSCRLPPRYRGVASLAGAGLRRHQHRTNVASMCQGYRKDSWSLTSAAPRGGRALQDGGEEVPSARDHLEVRAVATAGAVAAGPRA